MHCKGWQFFGVDAFTRPWSQGYMKCCPVPFTSCDLCICRVWSCYMRRFWRRCIYKKMHLESSPYKMVPSTLYTMWPMHLQSLKLLCARVLEKMHLQEMWKQHAGTYLCTYDRTDKPTDWWTDSPERAVNVKCIFCLFVCVDSIRPIQQIL